LQPDGPEDEGEAKRLRKGSGDVASEIDSPSVSLADKMQRIRLTCPSDLRIDWTPFTCCGEMHEWECFAKAQTFALRLIRSPLAKVAHVKFGMTQNPYFRFTTLPHDPASDTTVEPHYLHWSRMYVVFGGSGSDAGNLERKLIAHFGGIPQYSDKVRNILGGKDGVVGDIGFTYMLVNSLQEVTGHALALAKSLKYDDKYVFCEHCHTLMLQFENPQGVFAKCCACSYVRL
jgi:hypothetical protein